MTVPFEMQAWHPGGTLTMSQHFFPSGGSHGTQFVASVVHPAEAQIVFAQTAAFTVPTARAMNPVQTNARPTSRGESLMSPSSLERLSLPEL